MTQPETLTYDYENIRFTCFPMPGRHEIYVVNAHRISDGRHLNRYIKQVFIAKIDADAAGITLQEHFEATCKRRMLETLGNFEPEPTNCYACDKALEADDDTNYQFDNALWVHFEGGYGMFVDEPDQGLVTGYTPKYRVVICHECAHALCKQVPWIERLIEPRSSHSHRTSDHPRLLAEGHEGWDLNG